MLSYVAEAQLFSSYLYPTGRNGVTSSHQESRYPRTDRQSVFHYVGCRADSSHTPTTNGSTGRTNGSTNRKTEYAIQPQTNSKNIRRTQFLLYARKFQPPCQRNRTAIASRDLRDPFGKSHHPYPKECWSIWTPRVSTP